MAPPSRTMSTLEQLEDLKKDIRSLLVARNSEHISLPYLNKLYKDITDEDIPFRDFNCTSLKQFLQGMPDVLNLRYNKAQQLCAYHIDTEKSKHISSLVSREKKDISTQRRKSLLCNNPVDPQVLNNILQELKISATEHSERKKIKKADVLSSIEKCIGEYAFYSMKDLNNQLNELTHILTHDDGHIYFKQKSSRNKLKDKRPKKSNFNLQKIRDENNDKKSNGIDKQITYIEEPDPVSDLIKEATKLRLQKLMEKHPKGIWSSELPLVYQREYGLDLEYSDLGFNSIIEFVSALPKILKIVTPLNARKQLVLDARISIDDYKTFQVPHSISQKILAEDLTDHFEAIPDILSSQVTQALIPDDFMGFNDTIDQISVSSLRLDPENSIDVVVSEVNNPSFFWVTLLENKKVIIRLMTQLQEFYMQQDLDKCRVPEILVKPGLHIACIFQGIWHRGIIKKIDPKGPMIHFYDFGTESTYNSEDLYFLSMKFSTIPAQAIPCSLHDVQPIRMNKWPLKTSQEFTEKVFDKSFIAYILQLDKENNSMAINLLGMRKNLKHILINEWMVKKEMANWGESDYQKSICKSTFKHYEQHFQKHETKSLNVASTKKVIDAINRIDATKYDASDISPANHISFNEKLKAIRKYKTKLFNNSSGLSSSMDSFDNNKSIAERTSNDDSIRPSEHFDNEIKIEIHSNYLEEEELNDSKTSYKIDNSATDDSNLSYSSSCSTSNSVCSGENMFKYCYESSVNSVADFSDGHSNERNQSIKKTFDNEINNTLKELRKLMSSTKI